MHNKIYILVRKNNENEKLLFYVENEVLAEICNRFLNKNCKFSYAIQRKVFDDLEYLKFQYLNLKKIKNFDEFVQQQIHSQTQEPRIDKEISTFVKLNNLWYKLDDAFSMEHAVIYDFYNKPHKVNATVLEKQQAENWSKLDWSNTKVYDNYETGLLSPSGKFYGCDLKYMEQCANFVLHMTLKQLSKLGFVQINAVKHQHKKELVAYPVLLSLTASSLTEAQLNFLEKRNVAYHHDYFEENQNVKQDLCM